MRVWITGEYAFVKVHTIAPLRLVYFIICNFYLKKERRKKRGNERRKKVRKKGKRKGREGRRDGKKTCTNIAF